MPLPTVKAKFRCLSRTTYSDGPQTVSAWSQSAGASVPREQFTREFRFMPVTDTSTPENEQFFTSTPTGELKMTVANPAVDFVPNREYYLTFEEVTH